MCKIIAIANHKGGVGKTTSAIGIGSSLAKIGKRVLLIDLDPQGNSTIALGFNNEKINRTVFSALTDKVTISKTVKKTTMENLSIVPSNIFLWHFSDENLANVEEKEYILKKQLEDIRSGFDYIIIDTPPSSGLINKNALTCSDSVIIPVLCEPFAMESITAILATIRKIKHTTNPNLAIEGFLFTMLDTNDIIQTAVATEIKSVMTDQMFDVYIPRNNSIPESQLKGIPISIFRPNSIGAQAYLQVAKQIVQKNS